MTKKKKINIKAKKGDITQEKVDAIVNPANSAGFMGGGVAKVICNLGGNEIEKEAVEKALIINGIEIGKAISTTAGSLPAKHVIHSPTMEKPAEPTSEDKVRMAMRAALVHAHDIDAKTLAFPGMGTGVGGLDKKLAARAMFEEIQVFDNQIIEEVRLIGYDDELYDAFLGVILNEAKDFVEEKLVKPKKEKKD